MKVEKAMFEEMKQVAEQFFAKMSEATKEGVECNYDVENTHHVVIKTKGDGNDDVPVGSKGLTIGMINAFKEENDDMILYLVYFEDAPPFQLTLIVSDKLAMTFEEYELV